MVGPVKEQEKTMCSLCLLRRLLGLSRMQRERGSEHADEGVMVAACRGTRDGFGMVDPTRSEAWSCKRGLERTE